MSRDHSVIFEIVSKYCISDSFVDYDGYSISSRGFLPTVVDITVIWTGRPGVLWFMGSQRVGHDWGTELNWTELNSPIPVHFSSLIPKMLMFTLAISSFSSVAQSCLTLYDPMNCSTPGLPVHHQLLQFTQTHAHRVGDAIQPSHPLLSPSPPAPNPSQHQGLFQWVSSSHEVAKVLEFQLQHQSCQWTKSRTQLSDWMELN